MAHTADEMILKCVHSHRDYEPDGAQRVADTLIRYGAHAGVSPQELASMLNSGMTVGELAAHLFGLLVP